MGGQGRRGQAEGAGGTAEWAGRRGLGTRVGEGGQVGGTGWEGRPGIGAVRQKARQGCSDCSMGQDKRGGSNDIGGGGQSNHVMGMFRGEGLAALKLYRYNTPHPRS